MHGIGSSLFALGVLTAVTSLSCSFPSLYLAVIESAIQPVIVPTPQTTSEPAHLRAPTPSASHVPTSAASPTPSMDQHSDLDLAVRLDCKVPCIGKVDCMRGETSDPRTAGAVDLISTGRVTHMPLRAEDAVTILGDLTVLEAMTREASSDPVPISLLLQASLPSQAGVNAYPSTYEMIYLIDLPELVPEVPDATLLRPDGQWQALLPRGSQWEFHVSALPFTKEAVLDGSMFHSEEYREGLA